MTPPTGGYGRDDGDRLAPHRGTMILVFGILGLLLCPIIFGLMAWIMGSGDLRAMREGRMDRSGEGPTKAGMICGMIGVIIMILWIVLGIAGAIALPWKFSATTY